MNKLFLKYAENQHRQAFDEVLNKKARSIEIEQASTKIGFGLFYENKDE